MKHHSARKLAHKKSKPLPPGFLNSPLIQGLVNLVPVVLVASLAVLNLSKLTSTDFRQQALTQGYGDSIGLTELALKSARDGDYPLAQSLYNQAQKLNVGQVLGINTQQENEIFPQKGIEEEINQAMAQVRIRPSRLLYLRLALLSWQLGNNTEARNYLDLARQLDPNDSTIEQLEKTLRR